MIIFNKRSSSSSSPHSNKHLESQPQSAIIKQDFFEFSNNYNNRLNDENDSYINSTPAYKDRNSNVNNSTNSLSPEEIIQMEEIQNDCVYQVTIKKVYNKSLQDDTRTVTAKANNIYGTYRPISNSFFSYVNTSKNNSNEQNNSSYQNGLSNYSSTSSSKNNQAINNNSSKDGLIYTRVKLRQLKYCTLPKLIMHLTNEETGSLDLNLVQIFLVTYRTFTDTVTALNMLRSRYEEILPASLEMTEDVRVEHLKSIRTILHMWLENYTEDFNEPPDYTNLNVLRNFVDKHLSNTEIAHVINTKYEYFESLANSSQMTSSNSRLSSLLSIKINLNDQPMNSMQTSYASTSQFSISPTTSTTSQQSTTSYNNNLPTHTNHRRSSSNVAVTDSQPIAEFMPHKHTQATLSHSRSHSNLNNNTTSKSPILNLISNSLKKSNATLITSLNSDQLADANLMQIDSQYFAEQLTYIDKCLFPKVCAHLCLGGVWSTRYRKTTTTSTAAVNDELARSGNGTSSPTNSTPLLSDKFASIGAFIDQFNCVSFFVQATVLENVDLRPSERAKIIKKWIEVACGCRAYKNFSSLNAIVQGLNTQCVSRLQKTWAEISSENRSQFDELTKMFSEDQNQKEFRSILARDLEEYAQIFDVNDKVPPMGFTGVTNSLIQRSQEMNGKLSDVNSGINVTLGRRYNENLKKKGQTGAVKEPLGTIPFLGTFLKDLEYLNAQSPKDKKDMVNVMQKRREFEIISQIKLLQQATQLYNIRGNVEFKGWLQKQSTYSEEQNYKLSYLIEPRDDTENNGNNRKTKTNCNILLSESTDSILSSILTGNKTPQLNKKNFNHSRHSSIGNNLYCANSSNTFNNNNSHNTNKINSPMIMSQISQTDSINFNTIQKNQHSSQSSLCSQNTSPNLVVKVIIEFSNTNSEHLKIDERVVASTVIYKRIFLKDSDRTKDVKKAILEKFRLDPETCDKYTLIQVFSQSGHKELPIGDNCNVYYAAKNLPDSDMQFVLRRRNSSVNGNTEQSSNNLNNIGNGNGNTLNNSNNYQQQSSSLSKASVFRSPVMYQANKFAKNIKNRRKTEQILPANGTYSRVFDDLPPHYPNK